MTRAWLFALFVLCPVIAKGYGLDTHTQMSIASIDDSAMKPPLFKEWGMTGSASTLTFPRTGNEQLLSIQDLIAQVGAREEDDFPNVRNHFYDPTNGRGLHSCAVSPGMPSPDRAVAGDGVSGTDFSFAKARKYMEQAFISSTKQDRDRSFGRLFESVGHVIHHIQDMAQPQHVRNDAHLDWSQNPWGLFKYTEMPWLDNRSRYEAYTDTIASSITSGGYQSVKMEEPTYYWRNNRETGLAQFTNANFVSQGTNFRLTTDGYISNATYPRPAPNGDVTLVDLEQELFLAGLCPNPGDPKVAGTDARCSLRGPMFFIGNNVTDNLTGEQGLVNSRAASYSIFNQDLQKKFADFYISKLCTATFSTGALFTVNQLTFTSTHQFVIPRAIGYSAGMIDYIFRGKIDLVPRLLPDGSADGVLEFKNLGDEQIDGIVRLYYDDADGVRRPVTGGEWPVTRLPPQGKVTGITIPEPTFPVPRNRGVYMMVFTGTMGLEGPIADGPGAVVAKLLKVPAPEIYWSWNGAGEFSPPRPAGPGGSFEISFNLPVGFDDFLRQNLANAHVKVDGRDYVATEPMTPASCDEPGRTGGLEMGYAAATEGVHWDAVYLPENRVMYGNLSTGQAIDGTADLFFAVWTQSQNYRPWCSTRLGIQFSNPYENHSVEYFIGDTSLFKFCSRLEPDPNGQFGTPKLVLSRMQGVHVHEQAIGVRVDSQPVLACPGY